MDYALIASATLLGWAGAPHCAAMCAAPCAAVLGRGGGPALFSFHLARLVGYALGGALAASSVALLASWSALSPALRPLWSLLNAAALVLGCWLLWQGRQPAWMGRWGRAPQTSQGQLASNGWQRVQFTARAAAAGAVWVAWPCGLLQSALLVASLSNGAGSGALAMAGFALASSPGLLAGPWLWRWISAGSLGEQRQAWAARAAGLLLLLGSAWALTQQLAPGFAGYCRSLW